MSFNVYVASGHEQFLKEPLGKRGDVGIVHTLSFLGPDHIITI